MNKTILKLAIFGTIFVTIFGSLFHFVYGWSGNNKIIGALTPVNESVWEHLKLALIPILLFALVEWYFLRRSGKNLLCAKVAEIWLVIFLITSFFYTYTGIIGFNTLWADIILTFVVPVIIGEYLSYKLLIRENQPKNKIIPAISLLILLFAFIYFTFNPPKIPLFEDPENQTYGLKTNLENIKTQEECEKLGATWVYLGIIARRCEFPASDAGKVCYKSTDCQRVCLIGEENEMSGKCSEYSQSGCWRFLDENGKADGVCVDF